MFCISSNHFLSMLLYLDSALSRRQMYNLCFIYIYISIAGEWVFFSITFRIRQPKNINVHLCIYTCLECGKTVENGWVKAKKHSSHIHRTCFIWSLNEVKWSVALLSVNLVAKTVSNICVSLFLLFSVLWMLIYWRTVNMRPNLIRYTNGNIFRLRFICMTLCHKYTHTLFILQCSLKTITTIGLKQWHGQWPYLCRFSHWNLAKWAPYSTMNKCMT